MISDPLTFNISLSGRLVQLTVAICEVSRFFPGDLQSPPYRVLPNVRRHANQVLRYVDACVSDRGQSVAAGIIYERAPQDETVMLQIDSLLDGMGVQAIWADRADASEWL